MYIPSGLDCFDLIAFYAFKSTILIIFFWGLYEMLKKHMRW
jgi:hypothetical protein